jgi:tetratricopeptide (TPR) repeat protein
MHKTIRTRLLLPLLSILLALSALVYLPGISGPYTFDDYPNLLNNSYVQVKSLDTDSLYHAAYSLAAGPLKRPVSMLSFAINHYFAGSFDDSTPYKLTNLIIHIINGLLVFWFTRLIFQRLSQINHGNALQSIVSNRASTWVAAAVALLWLLHPIQLTSVLYVVQRMTALSALFVLLGLILYLKGRTRMVSGRRGGAWLILIGLFGCGTLGALSKENAVLLPVFMLTLELVLFAGEQPWAAWRRLSPNSKRMLSLGTVSFGLMALIAVIHYALPNYSYRDFTMVERLLTESRVLFFYLSLILVPRISKFGLFHDDIEISTNLMAPWTTLPSVIGIIGLFALAILVLRKWPLFALGILWFFTSHLLESTVFALEIAHEHRNYLATFGVLLAVVHLIDNTSIRLGHKKLWWAVPVMAIAFAGITYFRATQWSNSVSLFSFEVFHNPESSSAQAGLGMRLAMRGYYDQGIAALRRASELEPNEAAHLINIQVAAASAGKTLVQEDHEEIMKRLSAGRLTATTSLALQTVGDCILTWCRPLQGHMEAWLKLLLAKEPSGEYDASMYYFLLGRTLFSQGRLAESIDAYRRSHEIDPKYLHPLIEVGYLYVRIKRLDDAEKVLQQLEAANRLNLHPRDREVAELARTISEARKSQGQPTNNR